MRIVSLLGPVQTGTEVDVSPQQQVYLNLFGDPVLTERLYAIWSHLHFAQHTDFSQGLV